MTNAEKVKFVESLIGRVKVDIVKSLDSTPDNWDGLELRQHIADTFANQTMWLDCTRTRHREYRQVAK